MINFKAIKYHSFLPLKLSLQKTKVSLKNISSVRCYPKKYYFPIIHVTPQLNIFEQIKVSEPGHSKILANLLNPKGTHGCNDLFLKLFFKVFIQEIEYNEKESWVVTAEKERYDIRIKNFDNSKIIIIENKSNNARDKPNQLYRYWYKGIYLAQLYRNRFKLGCFAKIIYLSPSDFKEPEEQSLSRPVSLKNVPHEKVPSELIHLAFFHDQVIKWLDLCIEMLDNKTNVYYFLLQYRNFWSCHV